MLKFQRDMRILGKFGGCSKAITHQIDAQTPKWNIAFAPECGKQTRACHNQHIGSGNPEGNTWAFRNERSFRLKICRAHLAISTTLGINSINLYLSSVSMGGYKGVYLGVWSLTTVIGVPPCVQYLCCWVIAQPNVRC